MTDEATLNRNKAVVLRFNREVIERGDVTVFQELMAEDFVNRTAPPGMSRGSDGMLATFNTVLRPAFPDLRVEVHDQIAEGDKVTTRKTIRGTHRGPLLGIAPTGGRLPLKSSISSGFAMGSTWSTGASTLCLSRSRNSDPSPATDNSEFRRFFSRLLMQRFQSAPVVRRRSRRGCHRSPCPAGP
jgi:predicted ester cyclase